MQFKHPEILYFLFLLVIPIIVHLFQLRRFKKEYFTNVKLLKELEIQTSKASKIKKWLLLLTRLILFTALIFAFAQPFFKAPTSEKIKNEWVILLDNSFSMQAKGSKGELLKRAVQELIEDCPQDKLLSILTPTEAFWDVDIPTVKNELLQLQYSGIPFDPDALIAKVKARKKNIPIDYIILTDGISVNSQKLNQLPQDESYFYVDYEAQNKTNVSIKNVVLKQTLENFYEIEVVLEAFGTIEKEIPLSLISNGKSVAKTLVTLKNKTEKIVLTLPKKDFHGYAQIDDQALEYDNTFYLSIEQPKKIKVALLGTPEKNIFLPKIFLPEEFELVNYTFNTINYSELENQNTIVLNELDEIPASLAVNLQAFYEKGGTVIIIPSENVNLPLFNNLIQTLGLGSFSTLENQTKKITKISFDHPIYKNVFEKKITNFQYPETKKSYRNSRNLLNVLSYEDGTPFLMNTNNASGSIYIFTAPINKNISNFQNSPLIVPTFFNMAQPRGSIGTVAYTLGSNEFLLLDEKTQKDNVLTLKNEKNSFIPMQQLLNAKVKVSFDDGISVSGNYTLFDDERPLKNLSFNYPRTESDLETKNESLDDEATTTKSLETVFNEIESGRTAKEWWKYFIIVVLIALLTELAIQKFMK